MFHNMLPLISRRPAAGGEILFVEAVRLEACLPHRNPRAERVILAGWLLIAAKCWLVTWLVAKYHMGFDPLWVTAPTIFCGLICTALYFSRE